MSLLCFPAPAYANICRTTRARYIPCTSCLQIVAAFGAYIVADELLNVSGLLAIVALGTWLAAKGNHRISSHVVKPMREVWCAVGHCWCVRTCQLALLRKSGVEQWQSKSRK